MLTDRFPVALKYAPKWWNRAYEEKHAAAITAAFQEFDLCDVYRRPWGVEVWTSVQGGDGTAAEQVVAMQERLRAAVEYACCDIADNVVEAA